MNEDERRESDPIDRPGRIDWSRETSEKLPGMTPNHAPERPIDIDKGDLS